MHQGKRNQDKKTSAPGIGSGGPNSRQRRRVLSPSGGESMTKQAFKKECDVNEILARYRETGAVDHVSQYAPQYGEVPSQSFYEAMNQVAEATSMFEDLPSRIRKRFDNDPGQFLAFVESAEDPSAAIIALGQEDRYTQPEPDARPSGRDEVPSSGTDGPTSEARQESGGEASASSN